MDFTIDIIKEGMKYPVDKFKEIKPPFVFNYGQSSFLVLKNQEPIYFQRKRLRVRGDRVVSKELFRVCIGARDSDGTENKVWLKPDGSIDTIGDNPTED